LRTRARWSPARVLKGLASLRLTVVLFVLSLLLVFFSTLAQIDGGIWTVVNDYVRSFVVWVPFQLFVEFGQVFFGIPKTLRVPGSFPFPGGYVVGGLLFVNLVAAHLVRFRVSWKRSGILLIHFGVILLLVGEFVAREWAVEGNMVIDEGSASNYVLHNRYAELAVIDTSGKDHDDVVVVPASRLRKGKRVSHPDLPFDVEVTDYLVNSSLRKYGPDERPQDDWKGAALDRVAVPRSEVSGTAAKQTAEVPAAYLRFLSKEDGKSLGTYLMSATLNPQPVEVGGKTYEVALRYQRTYKPYSLYLKEFRFDRYPGTTIPKNYSSLVHLSDPERGDDRDVLIRMNEPMRHRGDTFYQADFDKDTEKTTVLQVVRNPGWLLPYVSCTVVALGMLVHFGIHLVGFLRRRVAS
jgi:hypothetical protein